MSPPVPIARTGRVLSPGDGSRARSAGPSRSARPADSCGSWDRPTRCGARSSPTVSAVRPRHPANSPSCSIATSRSSKRTIDPADPTRQARGSAGRLPHRPGADAAGAGAHHRTARRQPHPRPVAVARRQLGKQPDGDPAPPRRPGAARIWEASRIRRSPATCRPDLRAAR